jgi:Annexin
LNDIDLEQYLKSEFRGKIDHDILKAMLETEEKEYDIQLHNDTKLQEDGARLEAMRSAKWDNIIEFFTLVCEAPPEYLNRINQQFETSHNNESLVAIIEKELSGSIKKVASFLVGMKLNPYKEIAKLIKSATRGFGTDELLLSSILTRYQCIMKDVMKSHEQLFGKTIRDRIMSETGFDYRKLLMQVTETGEEYSVNYSR